MKILLIIGIIIIFVLLFFIYKKSKGEDLMDFSINEGFNAEEQVPYDDLMISEFEMDKLGGDPDPLSIQNREEAKVNMVMLEDKDEADERAKSFTSEDYNELNTQQNEMLNQANTWIDKTAAYRTQGQGNLYADKINDPGNNMAEPPKDDNGNGVSDFIQLDNQGSKMDTSFLDVPDKKGLIDKMEAPDEKEHDMLSQDFEVTGDEDSAPASMLHQKTFSDSGGSHHNDTDIGNKISKCEEVKHCGELNDGDCGFCADDGYGKFYYGFGNKNGPMTNVCAEKKWTTNKDQCMELQDRKKCDEAKDDCAFIPPHKDNNGNELCGYCPATGKVIPMTKDKNVKYGAGKWITNDSCQYDWRELGLKSPLLKSDDCAAFAEANPCITPYHSTGINPLKKGSAHSKKCLKDLWEKTSGCTGEKPYSVTFDDLVNNKIPDIMNTRRNYKDIQSGMKKTYTDMINNDGAKRSIGTVIKSSMWCDNKESEANPCDNKYHGTGNVNNDNHEARELCRERIWRNSGCEDAGKENPQFKKEKGKFHPEYTKILNESSVEYKSRIMDLPVIANKKGSKADYPKKVKASQDCYGRDPPPRSEEYPGFFMNYTHKTSYGSVKLWGYLYEMNNQGLWQLFWVARKDGSRKINREQYRAKRGDNEQVKKEKYANQRKYFGWPGIPAEDIKMSGAEKYISIDDMVLEKKCDANEENPVSYCGNSCNKVLSELNDKFPRPQDCIVSDWSGWTVCSKPCKTDGSAGKRTRARFIIEEAKRGGQSCPTQKGLLEEEVCNNFDCYNKSFVQESFGNKEYQKAGVFDAKGKVGRHLVITHSTYLHVQEIEVYNDRNKNVALKANGGSTAASDWGWGGPPSRMNDGGKSEHQRWANSVHTHRGGNRWVRVSWPKDETITRIIVYNRPDGAQTRLNGATMTLYDSGWKELVSFDLNSKRKQIFHLGTENVFNHGEDSSCKTDKLPIQATDQEILNKKNEMSGNKPNNVGEGTCFKKVFEKSKTNAKGGDCDWSSSYFKWYGWGSRNWSVEQCAQKCLDEPGCNRFTFGKSNRWGGWGLGCRVSKKTRGGFCPITTDRYAANGWSWWGNSNYWGGTVYDKKGKTPIKPHKYIGDFQDSHKWNWYWGPKMGSGSSYKGRVARWGPGNDAMMCADKCRDYKYFGLQGWGRCYCSNKTGTGTQCHSAPSNYRWRWWEWYWPWGPAHCNKSWVNQTPSNRGRRAWWWYSWYGGYRTKVYKTPKGQEEDIKNKNLDWKKCSDEGGICNLTGKAPDNSETYMGHKGRGYRGTQNKTPSGRTCQNWGSDKYHRRNGVVKRKYRKGEDGVGNHNYCRQGDNDSRIWCYTTDRRKRWEYCNPKKAWGKGGGLVRYGTGNKWTMKGFEVGNITCNNATFGDPAPGQKKRCEFKKY